MAQKGLGLETLADRLGGLDERLRVLQESAARDAAATMEGQARIATAQAALAKAAAEQTTAHAVLAQWMRDWTNEVNAWRTGMDKRMDDTEARGNRVEQDIHQARGGLRVAMWTFGTALTVITGVFSGVMVRVIGELVNRVGR